jgi:hypothetical protein
MIRDPLADLVPAVRERVAPTIRYTALQWKLAAPAAVLGSLTHVTWDAFTHDGRWGTRHIGWLHDLHHGHTGAEWAQYASSAIGLVVVAAWGLSELRARPRVPRPATVVELGTRAAAAIGAVTVASGLAAAFTTAPPGWRMMLSQAAVVGTIMGAFSLLVVAGIWQMMTNRVEPRP